MTGHDRSRRPAPHLRARRPGRGDDRAATWLDPAAGLVRRRRRSSAARRRRTRCRSRPSTTRAARRCAPSSPRAIDERGVTFFTNYGSAKGRDLDARRYAAAQFLWLAHERQVRLTGRSRGCRAEETAAYFAQPPARLAARRVGLAAVAGDRLARRARAGPRRGRQPASATGEIPAPPHWGGYLLDARLGRVLAGPPRPAARPAAVPARGRRLGVGDGSAAVSGSTSSRMRRELHAHPELAYAENRTTAADRRHAADARAAARRCCRRAPACVCDLGPGDRPLIALRADIDALPIAGREGRAVPLDRRRGVPRLRARRAHRDPARARPSELARRELAGRVRLIFQPAEETVPGGALVGRSRPARSTASRRSSRCTATRGCETGKIGLRVGPDHRGLRPGRHRVLRAGRAHRPSAPDRRPRLRARAGHHRAARAALAAGRPARRRVARVGLGRRRAGGQRDPDDAARCAAPCGCSTATPGTTAEPLVRELVAQIVAPTGVRADVDYERGVPPVVNDAERGRRAARGGAVARSAPARWSTPSRAWAARTSPGTSTGCPARSRGSACGRPGGAGFDLHQGTFDIDEAALEVGVRYTVALARAGAAAARALSRAAVGPRRVTRRASGRAGRAARRRTRPARRRPARPRRSARGSAPTAGRPRSRPARRPRPARRRPASRPAA